MQNCPQFLRDFWIFAQKELVMFQLECNLILLVHVVSFLGCDWKTLTLQVGIG